MYLTFDEYNAYGGTLEESAFNALAFDVQMTLNNYTFNRLRNDTEFSEPVKRVFFEIMNLKEQYNNYVAKISDLDNPIIASSSNDGVSESYGGYLGSTSPTDKATLERQLENDIKHVIRQYLNGERNQAGRLLLYRGVY